MSASRRPATCVSYVRHRTDCAGSPPLGFPPLSLTYAATGTTLKYDMNLAEAVQGNATVALLERVADDANVARAAQAVSWDPFEVWRTRIKQPRDRAVKSARAGTSNGVLDRRG